MFSASPMATSPSPLSTRPHPLAHLGVYDVLQPGLALLGVTVSLHAERKLRTEGIVQRKCVADLTSLGPITFWLPLPHLYVFNLNNNKWCHDYNKQVCPPYWLPSSLSWTRGRKMSPWEAAGTWSPHWRCTRHLALFAPGVLSIHKGLPLICGNKYSSMTISTRHLRVEVSWIWLINRCSIIQL